MNRDKRTGQSLSAFFIPQNLYPPAYFGPPLEATVVFYKQTQHLSYERMVETLRELHGVNLSEGARAAMLARAGEQAAPAAEASKAPVINSEVVRSDETARGSKPAPGGSGSSSARAAFIPPSSQPAALPRSPPCARQSVVKAWVCDCYGAQRTAPAEVFQLCLAHQLRDVQRVLDSSPEELWAQAARKLLREAIHLRHRCVAGEMTLKGYFRRVRQLENQLDRLLEEEMENDKACQLQARFSRHRDKLLTFLYDPEVPPTNNESEQALRSSVVHRKVTNGFRSEWGAKAYAALQTVIATAK